MNNLEIKYNNLKVALKELGTAVIAFSGGVDSGVLTKVAYDVLGSKVIAVTACSPTYPSFEYKETEKIAKTIGVRHIFVKTEEFENDRFLSNPANRCYWCKRELFSKLKEIADQNRIKHLCDGTIYQDKDDHRPGLKANQEFNVMSPLSEFRFTKLEVRQLARDLNLAFADKPSGTCLSSRIPYGEKITFERIKRVALAEKIILDLLGDKILFRARDHETFLRIEVELDGWNKFLNFENSDIIKKLKSIGYKYITFDLEGYIPAGKRI